jgi:hypothetical protein
MERNKVDIIIGIVLCVFSLYFYIFAYEFIEGGMKSELGSMFLPRLTLFAIFCLSCLMLLNAFRNIKKLNKQAGSNKKEYFNTRGYSNILKYTVVAFTYWLLMPYLGFLISTPLMMFSVMYLLSARKWLTMACVSITLTVALKYACYYGLKVLLPAGVLFS